MSATANLLAHPFSTKPAAKKARVTRLRPVARSPRGTDADGLKPLAKGFCESTATAEAPSVVATFEEQVMPHRQQLLAMGIRYTRNRDAAEDLVQETLMRALGAWSSFIPGSNCRAWLCRILSNTFINHYRKGKRHNKFAYDSGDDAVIALYGNSFHQDGGVYDSVFGEQMGDEVTASLNTLSPEYREVIELADIRGLKYKDVADTLGIPMGTVMSRLHRARKQLSAQLENFAADEYGIRRAA